MLVLALVGTVVAGATGAFFTDKEVSEGNVFTAGAIDLRVDSTASYNDVAVEAGTWGEMDLGVPGVESRFFNYEDLKPGDYGENTISLHVYSNDAWGRFVVDVTEDIENGCTEPEIGAEPLCTDEVDGELRETLLFTAWLDEGETAGFQNYKPDPQNPGEYYDSQEDLTEGDNLRQDYEIEFWTGELAETNSWDFRQIFERAYIAHQCTEQTGHTDYERCNGLASDGRMVGSTTYYFGLAWDLPAVTGNEVQSDGMVADMTFEVEQYRNNDIPSWNQTPIIVDP